MVAFISGIYGYGDNATQDADSFILPHFHQNSVTDVE